MDTRPFAQPVIEGLDVEGLLDRINHDQELMCDILRRFAKSQRESAASLPGLLVSDTEAARRRAHELKGMLGNLGASALFEQAAQLSAQLREQRMDGAAELAAALQAGIPKLCDSIDAALGDARPHARHVHDPAGLADDFRALGRLLRSGRAREAQRLAAELSASQLPPSDRELIDAVAPLIEVYRLREALVQLRAGRDV